MCHSKLNHIELLVVDRLLTITMLRKDTGNLFSRLAFVATSLSLSLAISVRELIYPSHMEVANCLHFIPDTWQSLGSPNLNLPG